MANAQKVLVVAIIKEDRTNEHDPITRAFFFPYKSPNAPEGISKISITKDINPNNQPIC